MMQKIVNVATFVHNVFFIVSMKLDSSPHQQHCYSYYQSFRSRNTQTNLFHVPCQKYLTQIQP